MTKTVIVCGIMVTFQMEKAAVKIHNVLLINADLNFVIQFKEVTIVANVMEVCSLDSLFLTCPFFW